MKSTDIRTTGDLLNCRAWRVFDAVANEGLTSYASIANEHVLTEERVRADVEILKELGLVTCRSPTRVGAKSDITTTARGENVAQLIELVPSLAAAENDADARDGRAALLAVPLSIL